MSEPHLKIAREFIQDRDFVSARKVLKKIPNDPTAKKWLARIDEIERKSTVKEQTLQPVELPIRLEVTMRNHLRKDEVVLWHEQPEPVIYSRYLNPDWQRAMFLITGIGLLLLQIYLHFNLISRDANSFFPPLILIASPFISLQIAQRRATTIHYILTNHQAFIIEKLEVKPISPINPSRIELVTERAGFESVIFHRYSGLSNLIIRKLPIGFLGIARADSVKKIISKYHR
jgi:hypothetical protein